MILPTLGTSIASVFFLLGFVSGQTNVTVDDTAPAIKYTGTWYTPTGERDSYGGGHHWSSQSNAYATFNFTGVAVYYMMPLFQGYIGGVSTLLTLDSGPAQLVNITRVSTEPTTSAVRWSATGLENRLHTVMVSLGRSAKGELANYGLVDGFIYTVKDPSSNAPTPTPTPASTNALASLQKCQPCGKTQCTFSPQGSPSYDTYSLIVGKPVTNCDPGNNETVTSQYSTTMTVTETWSIDTTIGVSFSGLSVGATAGWSMAQAVTAGQQVTMSILPGKMAALTANVSYKKTSGTMHVGSDSWGFSSIQPAEVGNYSVRYADCGNLFDAFTLSSTGCSAQSAAYMNRFSLMLTGLMGTGIAVAVCIML